MEQADAFCVVVEGTAEALAKRITAVLPVPTIGIGASPCAGQTLVTEHMLGAFSAYTLRFVKQYADTKAVMEHAIRQYADEVRNGAFPASKHGVAYGKPLAMIGVVVLRQQRSYRASPKDQPRA
ncbi:ketopantoate hydroxymethyltransferase [Paraburkholderia sp. BL21I4N1]|nr:ketopantoate hydroxymethyltransferase [Paraburkholderia sp. BL21I4N1]